LAALGRSSGSAAPEMLTGEYLLGEAGRPLCTIAVNHGAFPSAAAAAAASDAVDWFAPDSPSAAICTESFAATELRHYLCALLGLDPAETSHFPIRSDATAVAGNVIVVGNARTNRQCALIDAGLGLQSERSPSPSAEGFHLKTVKKPDGVALLLAGFDRVGTLYAVYDFLHQCGVRWHSPNASGEVVSARTELRVPALDKVDAPKFSLRGYWAEFFSSDPERTYVMPRGKKGTIEFFNWMARNRMNYWNASEQGVPVGEMLKRGVRLTSFAQTSYTLLDPAAKGEGAKGTYAEEHPEWFGQGPDGKRHFPTDPFGYDFCTSNPGMVAEFVRNMVRQLAGDLRGAEYMDWVPEDEPNRWCQCDECQKLGTPTDRNILMAHHIRTGLKRAFAEGTLQRDIKVNFIIYLAANVLAPPTRSLPAGFDYENIMACFFPIHRCYVHALDDPDCTEFNRPYIDALQAWRQNPYYKGRIMIGEFYNVSGFRDLPILFTRTMEQDIRYHYEQGVRAMHYMHIPVANWGPRALTNYQFAAMLWNPAVDVEGLIDEYFRLRYESAHAQMKAFYVSLEAAMLNVPAYVSTPASYNSPLRASIPAGGAIPAHLNRLLHQLADGRTMNLFPFRHLRMQGDHPPPDDGPSLETTIGELGRSERLMDQALGLAVGERVRACILEDEALFRYAAATVRLYFYLARSTQYPLRSPAWRRELKLAGFQADYLDSHPIGLTPISGGTVGMMRNALEATGIADVYQRWKSLLLEG